MASSQDTEINHTVILDIDVSDVPRFIGRGGSGIKENIIKPSWKLYNHYASLKGINAGGSSPSEKLYVLVSDEDGSVKATIKCRSDEMLKFATKSVGEYLEIFSKPRDSPFHYIHFYTVAEHRMIARYIGRGGQTIKTFTQEVNTLLGVDESSRNNVAVSIKPFHIPEDGSMDYLKDKKFAFLNDDGSVSDSVVSEMGSMIFMVLKVHKSVSGGRTDDDLYSELNDTVSQFLKPTHQRNADLEEEIERALGENFM